MNDQVSVQLRLRATPPVLSSVVVRRPRLEARLSRGAELPVTLVSAGPGWGKTVAVASWLTGRADSTPVAWLTLDQPDNDLRTFWSDVLAALITSGALTDTALCDVMPASGFGAPEALQVRGGLVGLPEPVVLVLDDVHLLTDLVVLQSLDRLLDHQGSLLRLILITRTDPPLRLHRLRINAHLKEIRVADLAFTDTESAQVLDRGGISLSERQLAVLHSRTQGWPAAVRLAAMFLDPEDLDSGLARFSGNERSVAEYLVGEVLEGLSPRDRDFLLKTSPLERISGPLATVLTDRPDTQAVLERLAAANALVVALGGGSEWFGYHPLFRELLAHQLALELPGTAVELHLRAARWFAVNDEPIPAILHASRAQEWDEVGRILLFTAAPLLVTADATALATALLPAATRAAGHPSWSTLIAAAAYHFQSHDLESMRQDIADAREHLADADTEVRAAAEVFLTSLMMSYCRGRLGAAALVATASAASHLLDSVPRPMMAAARPFRVVADNNLAVGLLWSGDFAAAEQKFNAVAAQAGRYGLGLTSVDAAAHLAVLDALHGRLHAADRRVTATTADLDRRGWGSEGQALAIYLTSGLTLLARNDLDRAAGQIERGLAVSTNGSDLTCRRALGIASVMVSAAAGEGSAVAAAADGLAVERESIADRREMIWGWSLVAQAQGHLVAGAPDAAIDRLHQADTEAGYVGGLARILLAKAQLMLDQPGRALDTLGPGLREPSAYLLQSVDARVVASLAFERLHHRSAALTALAQAIDLAQPEGIISPFVVAGPVMSELIGRHRQVVARHLPFTRQLTASLAPDLPSPAPAPNGFEHLTERELVVLRYLPTMLKASEIASDLFVSVNTVKQHNKSIYRKLGAITRRDAVDRARALNLL